MEEKEGSGEEGGGTGEKTKGRGRKGGEEKADREDEGRACAF